MLHVFMVTIGFVKGTNYKTYHYETLSILLPFLFFILQISFSRLSFLTLCIYEAT